MLVMINVHRLNIVHMMLRMRVHGCTLMEQCIVDVNDALLAVVLHIWRGIKVATGSVSKIESTDASSKSRSVECYTCGGRGHYMRDCPNQKKNSEAERIDYTHAAGYPDVDDPTMYDDVEPTKGLSMLAREVKCDGSVVAAKGQRSIYFNPSAKFRTKYAS
uniref:CCHC-type domain-containing protein n=1 Tax=Leersia perrieri TaxID=77586 RepID=A0A0D9WVC3_9ORYZ